MGGTSVETELESRVFRTLLDSRVPVAIFSWRNAEGWPVEFVSPNVEHVLGYAADDFLSGRVSYANIIHRDDLARVTEEVAAGGRSGAAVFEHLDYRIVDPTGRIRWVRDNTAVIRDADGRITHYFGYILDSTARCEAVQALELARSQAEAAARAKSEFLANVSHELRTPLTLVLGPIQGLLDSGDLPAEARRRLERVERNAERLNELVNDLLDFAKLDAGRERVQWEALDLTAVLSRLIEDVSAAAEARRLDLELAIHGDPGAVAGDRLKIERIALNLVGNAIKFTPPGGRVTVTLRFAENDVELSVADTGPGIPSSELERIFQRFEQGDASATRSHEGAGLGLALVKGFTELMGGEVAVESEVGVGSRFTVRLPRSSDRLASTMAADLRAQRARSRMSAREAIHERSDTEGTSRAERPRVVVADDNADMRAFMAEILEDAYDVETVASGAAAIASTRSRPPSVVVCDVMMPELDGLEVVRQLKADPELRSIPVVLVTARAGRADAVSGLEAGADDYLAKPFDAMELRARVHAAERLHRVYREVAAQRDELVRTNARLRTTQEQLVQSGKLAAVGTLTAGVSHELNNPMATILLTTRRLLRDTPETAPAHARLEAIQRQAIRCQRLLGALLDLVRQKPVGHERVPVSALIDRVGTLARSQALGRELVVEAEPTSTDLEVEGSMQELETALLNMVTNALDATSRGGRVSVVARRSERAGPPGVEIAVTDTGSGIPSDVLAHIFDPFFTTKPVGKGTGLGLALAQRIVHDAGGRIEVETAVGQGTTMRVWLASTPTPIAAQSH